MISIDDNDAGVVTINCHGMESILLEKDVDSSVWLEDRDALSTNWVENRIDRVIPFNVKNRKNRTSTKIDGCYGFSGYRIFDSVLGLNYWSTRDIVEYLLKKHTPISSTGSVAVPFELDDSDDLLPGWDSPEIDPSGQKTKDVIDSLITRARGLLYWLEVESGVVKMKIGSYASQEKQLPWSANVLNQNPNRYIFLTDSLLEGSVRTSISGLTRFDRVRCIGARAIYCFSLSGPDGTLIDKFKAGLADSYDDGASFDAGYPSATETEQRERADRIARSHFRFKNVYSRLGVKIDDPDEAKFWNGKVKNGIGTGAEVPAVPDTEFSSICQDLFPDQFRFLYQLPLLKNYDYEGSGTPTVITYESDEYGERYLPSLSFFIRPDDTSKWIEGQKIAELSGLETPDVNLDLSTEQKVAPFDFTVTIEPDPDDSAFNAVVTGNDRHVIAPRASTLGNFSEAFTPLDYEASYIFPKWNYATAIFTVAVHGNDYCEGTAGVTHGVKDRVRTKTIYLGDRFQKHHIAEGTVVGINEATGQLKRRSASGFVRDDSEQVASIAEFAFNWYSLDRATIELTTHHFGDFQLGNIVSSLKAGESVTFDDSADKMTVAGAPYDDDDAVVFYLDDGATLPEPLTPGNIYYVTSIGGNDYQLSHQIGGSAIDLTTAGSGNAYVTDNGANTPVTSIELELPVEENTTQTSFGLTTIRTGHSEFDINNFY